MFKIFPPHACDFYKTGHIYQYEPGTSHVYSNFTARSATHASMPKDWDGKVVFFGFQAFVKSFLIYQWNEEFFKKPKNQVVRRYQRRMDMALGAGVVTADHIAALHDLGFLPVLIKALPEGSRVNLRVPFFTVQNDPNYSEFFWLTNYLEDALSAENWKPCTVATTAYEFRRLMNRFQEATGSAAQFVNWQLHDFSMRGLDGLQPAGPVGGAHLAASGYGTDNILALDWLEDFYNADAELELLGGGVPATEHSVMCLGGTGGELATIRRLMARYPTGILSIVSDTWDFWKVITVFAKELRSEILTRQPDALGNAKIVFRPDSGDPVKIIAGMTYAEITDLSDCDFLQAGEFDPEVIRYEGKFYEYEEYYANYDDTWPQGVTLGKEVPEHVVMGAVECLWEIFGGDITDKGYRTLNQRVGLIYGDSITLARQEAILQRLMDKGFSAGNLVFGIGSYTYQYLTRDTFGMAMKATFGVVDGEYREMFKDPATGDGMKKSAKGLLRVEKEGDDFVLYDQQTHEAERRGALEPVFYCGALLRDEKFSVIRERLGIETVVF